MKTCPTCKARCFDDMEVCYGCMHRFYDGGEEEGAPVEESPAPSGPLAGGEAAQVPAPRSHREAPPRRRPPLKGAYVFGSSGTVPAAAEGESALLEGPEAVPAEVESKAGPKGTLGIVPAGGGLASPGEVDPQAVSQLMSTALAQGRRLIICIE